MAIPSQLRYWLIRLKALNRPVLWCPGLAVVLLAVVINEYRQHPEWLGRFEVERGGASQAVPGSTLSPEEQANVADIDNLSALYSDLGLDPLLAEPTSTTQAATEPSQDLLSVLQSAASPPSNQPAAPEAAASPFSRYLEQYRLPGSSAPATSTLQGAGNRSIAPLLAAPASGGALTEPTASNSFSSPLQQAIQQLSGQQLLGQEFSSGPVGSASNSNGRPGQNPSPSQSASPNFDSGSFAPGISPAILPGTNQTFLRTTPQMSPAPGTTGYVPPATLTLPGGPYNASPPPGPASVTPNLSPVSPGQPSNSGFQTPGTGGTALPPATGSLYDTPDTLASPAPFSAPRPPGSYAGNGYIYTFSDPNGPVR